MQESYGSTVADLNRVLNDFFRTRSGVLEAAAEAIARSVRAGGKVLLFGNGGSAAEAQHFAAELVNGMQHWGRPPIPAIAMTTDTSSLTAIGNDRGFALVFSRQVEALGRPGDVRAHAEGAEICPQGDGSGGLSRPDTRERLYAGNDGWTHGEGERGDPIVRGPVIPRAAWTVNDLCPRAE